MSPYLTCTAVLAQLSRVRPFVDSYTFSMPLSILLSPYIHEFCGCSHKCEASLAKDCQGCLHSFYGVSMRLRVRHGILGETALTIEVLEQTTLGWDIMKQTAMVLRLDSPFQVVLYADSSSVIQSPLRAVQLDTVTNEATLCALATCCDSVLVSTRLFLRGCALALAWFWVFPFLCWVDPGLVAHTVLVASRCCCLWVSARGRVTRKFSCGTQTSNKHQTQM